MNRSVQAEGDFGILKQDHGYTRVRRRGLVRVSAEMMLTALGLNVAKLYRFYETGKTCRHWVAPDGLEPEVFKKPSWKRLPKRGRRINDAMRNGVAKNRE